MSHKYGIELPSSILNAIEIDCRSGNTFCQDALAKEMGNVCVAFEILGQNAKAPPGWHKALGHIVFYVKMDFTQKAQWVKDGHKTHDSTTSSFAGRVSHDSIRISLTYAALLGLPVIVANICNAYLQAPSSEKHFIICGHEFGIENEGCVALMWRALYGGKIAGRDFWHHLQDCMGQLGFSSSCADPDVWLHLSKSINRGGILQICFVICQESSHNFQICWHCVMKRDRPTLCFGGRVHWTYVRRQAS
jgi:hypothetical protein